MDDESDFEVDWSRAVLVVPEKKKLTSIRVDRDVLEFFKSQGPGHLTRMNAVLRHYVKQAKEVK